MKFYGIELAAGAQITNSVVERGDSTPSIANMDGIDYLGRLFFNTVDDRIYVWTSTGWTMLGFYGVSGGYVSSVNGRQGNVTITASDVLPLIPIASTTQLGMVRIGAGLDVSTSGVLSVTVVSGGGGGTVDLSAYALLHSPDFTGLPTAPTAIPATSDTTLATTAFVHNVVSASTSTPTSTRPVIDYISMSGHNCIAILSGGKLYTTSGVHVNACTTSGRFQYPYYGSVGLDSFKQVTFPYTSSSITKTGGYGYVAYALFASGELYTWGYNSYGQCGLGHTTVVGFPVLAAVGVTDVYTHPSNNEYAVDYPKLVIKKSDGYLYSAGYNGYGQLGIGNVTPVISSFTRLTDMGQNPISVWNLGTHLGNTIVQKADGTIWVAGYNGYGQLGTGNTSNASTFVDVTTAWGGLEPGPIISAHFVGQYASPSVGQGGTLGILRKNSSNVTSFRLCGNNAWGQIGNSSTANATMPYLIPLSNDVKQVAFVGGGPVTVQALTNAGNLYAWGYNGLGNVGNGTTVDVHVPALITSGVSRLLSDGQTSHTYSIYTQTFIIKSDGYLYVVGHDDSTGYTGTGGIITLTNYTRVRLPQNVRVKWFGSYATQTHGKILVVISENDTIYGWGYNHDYGISYIASNYGNTTPMQFGLTVGE